MEKRELTEKFYSAFQLPLLVRRKNETIQTLGGDQMLLEIFHKRIQEQVKKSSHRLTVALTDYDMYAACLKLKDSDEILVGPVHGNKILVDRMRKFCRDLGVLEERQKEVIRWLGGLPAMAAGNFSAAVTFLYFSLTGENAETCYMKCHEFPGQVPDLSQMGAGDAGIFDEIKQRILTSVEKGDVEELDHILGGWYMLDDNTFPVFSENRMKSMQLSLAAMILYAGQAAVRGGVTADVVTAQTLLDYERLFAFHNGREFMQCFKEIAREYAVKVRECRSINRESALVRKIDHVIQEHLWQKLTPTLIAEELEMNLSYLCREFKKSTRKTIGEYINERKIGEAKRLLKTTDLSLVEIADTLGFSSQSYFHRVFKRLTGQTPMEYRER